MRKMLGAGGYVFDEVWEPLIQSTEQFLLKKAFKEHLDIVIDDARMVFRKHRKSIIGDAKQHGYNVIIVETPRIDRETSVNRRLKNNFNESLTREVCEAVYDKFEKSRDEVDARECKTIVSLQKNDNVVTRLKGIV
jgi:predicted kinase